jgi:putative methionine-R-sulfoxide reductase with GAF domain
MSSPPEDLFRELERTEEASILRILKIIRQAQDFRTTEELHAKIVNAVHDIYRAYYHVSIFMTDPDRKVLRFLALAGRSAEELLRFYPDGYTQPVELGICGQVFRTGKMYLSNDVRSDPLFVEATNVDTRSELCLPIYDMRTPIGGLNIESDQVGTFTATDVYLFEVLAHAIGGSVTRDRLSRELVDATGALGAMGSAQPEAIVVLTPEGLVKYGNSRFIPYRRMEGLLTGILNTQEGEAFDLDGEDPSGTRHRLQIVVMARRGGYVVAKVVPR